MQKFNLRELVAFDEKPFMPNVLAKEPGYRLVFVNIRAGHQVPEHSTPELVTIYAVSGRITFHSGGESVDLKAGEVLTGDGHALHHIEAHEDSSLLVVAAAGPAEQEEVIDVRTIEGFRRHPFIFGKFDELAVGQSFILVNDHDPMPLHRQMESMRPDQHTWEYLRRGPDIFQIRVRRIAPLTGTEVSPGLPSHTISGIRSAR